MVKPKNTFWRITKREIQFLIFFILFFGSLAFGALVLSRNRGSAFYLPGAPISSPTPTEIASPTPSHSTSPTASCSSSPTCSTVTISCETPDQLATSCHAGATACTDSYPDCKLHLSIGACEQLTRPYYTGQVITPSDCSNQARNGHPTTALEAAYLCLVSHECTHAGDPACTDGSPLCKTESNAYSESISCLSKYYYENCVPTRNDWTDAGCKELKSRFDYTNNQLLFNKCLCSSGATCAKCTTQCQSNGGSAADCKKLGDVYCHANNL